MQSRQGRPARAEHSSRANQFWDTEVEPIFDGPKGHLTASEFYSRYGNASSMLRGEAVATRFIRKSCSCGGQVRMNDEGFAICDRCNLVLNDGNPKGIELTSKEKSGAPPNRYRKPKRAAR